MQHSKIFLGYYPFYATDKRYEKFYRLAEEVGCPVMFHTGDTFGNKYLVKYAHPLQLDEVAVKFPNTKFIIAHMGNPWIRDTAEVVYKNPNVFTDLSALYMGSSLTTAYRNVIKDIQYVFGYVDDPGKFLYGSDWPLVRMKTYIDLIKKALPVRYHQKFFYENAVKLFKLESQL